LLVLFNLIKNKLIEENVNTEDEIYEHLLIICNPLLVNQLTDLRIKEDKTIKEYVKELIENERTSKKNKFKLMEILENLEEF